MTILHFIPDEKFTPFLQDLFSTAIPSGNRFVVYGFQNGEPRFAKKNLDTKFVSKTYWFSEALIEDLRNATVVVVHSLSHEVVQAICRAPLSLPVVWRGWGFDYYNYLTEITGNCVLPATKKIWDVNRGKSISDVAKSIPKRILKRIIFGSKFNTAIERVNYFSCCVPQDFDRLKIVLPWGAVSFMPLNYYSVESSFVGGEEIVGDGILLGNSATPENNHVEAMEWLRDQYLGSRRVVVPLSYGDKIYAKKIVELGNKWLGKNFFPLLDYYSIEQYNKITAECSVVFMNHVRQQGMGNIAASLYRGAKVILRPENPILDLYSSIGVKVDCFESNSSSKGLPNLLSADESILMKNRRIVSQYWAHEVALGQARQICTIGNTS